MSGAAGARVYGRLVRGLSGGRSFSAWSTKGGNRTMTKRYLISVEPIEPSGVVLTIAELPGLVIFGQTAEDALGWAREAIAFQLRDAPDNAQQPALEFVLGRAS